MPRLYEHAANRYTSASATCAPWVQTIARANFTVEPKKSFVYSKIHFRADPNRTQATQANCHRIKHLRKFEKANTLILCPISLGRIKPASFKR